MRYFFSFWVLFTGLWAADPARADMLRTCVFVETLAGLPGELRLAREGRGDVAEFRKDLADSLRKVNDRRRAAVFLSAERRVLQKYLSAVRDNWHTYGLKKPGAQMASGTTISAQTRGAIVVISAKYGCNLPLHQDEVPLSGVKAVALDPLTALAAIAALIALILAILKLMRFGHREQRMICRVPAWLRFGENTYATQIMNISRGGVMVEAPESDMNDTEVTLALPSMNIDSRVVWTNSNFMGLVFEKKISAQMVEEIANQRQTAAPKDHKSDAVMPPRTRTKASRSPSVSASLG